MSTPLLVEFFHSLPEDALRGPGDWPFTRLDMDKEIRRLLAVREGERYVAFCRPYWQRANAKAIERIRRRWGDPTWVPRGILNGWMRVDIEAERILRRLYRRWRKHKARDVLI